MKIRETLYLAFIASPYDEGNFRRVFKARFQYLAAVTAIFTVLIPALVVVSKAT